MGSHVTVIRALGFMVPLDEIDSLFDGVTEWYDHVRLDVSIDSFNVHRQTSPSGHNHYFFYLYETIVMGEEIKVTGPGQLRGGARSPMAIAMNDEEIDTDNEMRNHLLSEMSDCQHSVVKAISTYLCEHCAHHFNDWLFSSFD